MAAGVALSRAVKLQQIQCVVAAARRGSFRRAAQALNVQQSSVSRCVQELEGSLGAPLFRRSPGGVEVTEVGARFLADAEVALDQLSRAAQLAGAAGDGERNTVRIGAASIPGSGFLPELVQAFTESRPGHRISLHEAPSPETVLAVHTGSLDLAVVLNSPRGGLGAEVTPMWREPLLLATPLLSSWRAAPPVAWHEIVTEGLILPTGEIGDMIAARLIDASGDRAPAGTCRAGAQTALRLVSMGQGRAIVTAGARELGPPGLSFSPVVEGALQISAVRMTRNEKPALRRLMALLHEFATASGTERG